MARSLPRATYICGIFLSACLFFVLHYSSYEEQHHRVKRDAEEIPEDDDGYTIEGDEPIPTVFNPFGAPADEESFVELLPGQLICQVPKEITNTNLEEGPFPGENLPPDVRDRNKLGPISPEIAIEPIEPEEKEEISEVSGPRPAIEGLEPPSPFIEVEGEESELEFVEEPRITEEEGRYPVGKDTKEELLVEKPVSVGSRGGPRETGPDGEKEELPIINPPVDRIPEEETLVTGWTDEEKYIGCCPSGDRNGVAFKAGMACCVDEIYDATLKFCCLSKQRSYEITIENMMFCYPPDRIPFCRMSDLGMDNLRPMDIVCKTKGGKNKNPSECTFTCPVGSQVRGDKRVVCSEVGTWNDANPQCCEGCPPEFKQDIWFVVDIDERIGEGNLSSVRSFMKLLLSYFPIGQDKVRVGVTPYNGRVFKTQGGWFLDRYNTTARLMRAINRLPREGVGRHTGEVLAWLAEQAFDGKLGDRPDVPNMIVLITSGPPDDNHLQAALERLHDISRFVVVAVGPGAEEAQFQNTVSPPLSENFLRVPTFHDLDRDTGYLYSLLCQEHCLQPLSSPK